MKKNKFRIVLEVIAIIVFLSSISYLIKYKYDALEEKKIVEEVRLKKQRNIHEKIKKEEVSKTTKKNNIQLNEKKNHKEKKILSEYEELYNENNDLYGWIKIAGTEIDYPVMHTPSKLNFYNDKNWEKQYSIAGSIWLDKECTNDSENLIIYGHHMADGTMFGSLEKYKTGKDYYEKHKYIEFDTIYEKAKYEIIAVSKTVIYYKGDPPEDYYEFYKHVELDSKEEYDEYVQKAKENSYYDTKKTAEYGEKLITLCTCDYWTDNARLLIIAKKIT